MKINSNIEFIISLQEDGILMQIYKRVPTNKLMIIDFSIAKESFELLKDAFNFIEEVEVGHLLYTGRKNIKEVSSILTELGIKHGINNTVPVELTDDEKIESYEKNMKKAVDDEDFVKAAMYRDKIKELKK